MKNLVKATAVARARWPQRSRDQLHGQPVLRGPLA